MITIQGWELRRLTDLAEYINGYAFKPEDWGEEGLPIIRIEQLKNPYVFSSTQSASINRFLDVRYGHIKRQIRICKGNRYGF